VDVSAHLSGFRREPQVTVSHGRFAHLAEPLSSPPACFGSLRVSIAGPSASY
jgi:hypothetical protein